MNAISYLIISYFGAALFPVDLVTKRAMLEVARRASSRLFSQIFLRNEQIGRPTREQERVCSVPQVLVVSFQC